MRKAWRLWAKAIGEKSGVNVKEADRIAIIRTCIVLCYVVTNFFIIIDCEFFSMFFDVLRSNSAKGLALN